MGSLAIAWVLPKDQINLTSGVMQAFTNFFEVFHLSWMIPVIAIMILIGSIGGTINWIISPAKGLLQAAQSGYLPKFFQHENKQGVPANILIVQALIVSVVCLLFLFMPSVNGSYWLLTALTTEVYMIVYVIMFIAAIRLRYKFPHIDRPFKIPGANWGMWIVGILGLLGCAVTLTVGFFPPSGIDVGGHLHYVLVFTGGLILMVLPTFLFYGYRVLRNRK
jgi:amino acid transporter